MLCSKETKHENANGRTLSLCPSHDLSLTIWLSSDPKRLGQEAFWMQANTFFGIPTKLPEMPRLQPTEFLTEQNVFLHKRLNCVDYLFCLRLGRYHDSSDTGGF